MNTEDEVASLIAENLRTLREARGLRQDEVAALMNERLGIQDVDESDAKRMKRWHQSTLYKIESVPPARKVSFREGVMLADIYGVSADSLLRPTGSKDDQWAAIVEAAAELDSGVHDLDHVLRWTIQRSRVLDRVVRVVPKDSLPFGSERVLVNAAPELLQAMTMLQETIRKHGEVRQGPERLNEGASPSSGRTVNAIGEDGQFHDYDFEEWTEWQDGRRETHPKPLE